MSNSTVNVYFLISGEHLDSKVITECLSMKPTHSWLKGDLIPGRNRYRVDSCWIIATGDEESLDIEIQLNKIISNLKGKEDSLRFLEKEYDLDFQFNIVIKVEGGLKPIMSLSKGNIKFIGNLNANVDFDIYTYS